MLVDCRRICSDQIIPLPSVPPSLCLACKELILPFYLALIQCPYQKSLDTSHADRNNT